MFEPYSFKASGKYLLGRLLCIVYGKDWTAIVVGRVEPQKAAAESRRAVRVLTSAIVKRDLIDDF